jgi:hypothetical protein
MVFEFKKNRDIEDDGFFKIINTILRAKELTLQGALLRYSQNSMAKYYDHY